MTHRTLYLRGVMTRSNRDVRPTPYKVDSATRGPQWVESLYTLEGVRRGVIPACDHR